MVALPSVEVQYICYRTAESEWSAELVTLAFVSFSLNLEPDWGSTSRFIVSVPRRRFLPHLLCLQLGSLPSLEDRQVFCVKEKSCCLLIGIQAGKNQAQLCGQTVPRSPAWWFLPGFYTTRQAAGHTPPVPVSSAPPSGSSKLGQRRHLFTVREAV